MPNIELKKFSSKRTLLDRLFPLSDAVLDIEKVCFLSTIFIATYLLMIIPSVFEIYQFYKEIRVGFTPLYLLLVIPGFLISKWIFMISEYYIYPVLEPYLVEDKATPGENKEITTKKTINYIYGSIYYTCSFTWLVVLAYKYDFMPPEIGGTLEVSNNCSSWPYFVPFSIQFFYMVTLGHHLERTANEFTKNKDTATFYTMVFHHLLAVMLIGLSFFNMQIKFGIPILLTHDFTDIVLNGGKLMRFIYPKHATNAFYVTFLLTWIYGRIYMYILNVLKPLYVCWVYREQWTARFFFLHVIYVPSLIALFGLNLFWLYQILLIGYSRLFKKDYRLRYYEKKDLENDKNRKE